MTTRAPLPRTRAAHAANDGGFVLVGVVMFVLALTILGISLFSLSSYESQFMGRSLAQEQAFNDAWSGIEKARYVLLSSGSLGAVAANVPGGAGTETVTNAVAIQDKAGVPDSLGMMTAGGSDIYIRVTAVVGGRSRTLSGMFKNSSANDYYRRLISASNEINVDVGTGDRNNTMWLDGTIYERANNFGGWTSKIHQPPPDSIAHNATWLQAPPAGAVFAAHPVNPAPAFAVEGPTPVWQLDALGQTPGYFGPPTDPLASGLPSFSFHYVGAFGYSTQFKIKVRGPAVWLLPRGFWGFGEVTVDTLGNGANAALVIVAGANTDPANYFDNAIWMETGLNVSPGVPVVLVANGRIKIYDGINVTTRVAQYVAMYGTNVDLQGGLTASNIFLELRHPPGAAPDQPGGLIDQLSAWGALPNGSTTANQLDLIAGSWQQSGN